MSPKFWLLIVYHIADGARINSGSCSRFVREIAQVDYLFLAIGTPSFLSKSDMLGFGIEVRAQITTIPEAHATFITLEVFAKSQLVGHD